MRLPNVANSQSLSYRTELDRREYHRFFFSTRLCGCCQILTVHGEFVEAKPMLVCVTDLSAGGLRMKTKLKLPIDDSIILGVTIRLFGETIRLVGQLVNGYLDLKTEEYLLGFKFDVDENHRRGLVRLVNQLTLHYRNDGAHPPECSFCEGDCRSTAQRDSLDPITRDMLYTDGEHLWIITPDE